MLLFSVNVAIPYAAYSIFSHQGQMCIAASRLYVQSGIYDKFVQGAVAMAKKRVIGNPTDPATEHGPQVSPTILANIPSVQQIVCLPDISLK